MAWIESHQTLRAHPKTKRLARSLNVSIPTAIGHLHCLWWWALDYAPDGDMSAFAAWEIADGAMWEGDPAIFIAALEDSFFSRNGVINDWHDYAGRLIQSRVKARERMAAYRARQSQGRQSGLTVAPEPQPATPEPEPAPEAPPAKPRQKRAGAITDQWEPTAESLAWATAQWPEAWVKRNTETFRDYYIGTGKPMKNWDATWRNWLRRDATRNPPKPELVKGGGDWFEA